MSLNERQKAFCEHYVACLNATEAARKAGYSEKTAYSIGNENLKKPEIKKYLESLAETSKSSRIATIDEVLTYLSNTMRNEDELTRERTKAAQILRDALSAGVESADTGFKVIVERKIIDLSKGKEHASD